MARPKKNNAEYFSHDANASSDEKLIYIESQFGNEGYALYFKMLEVLTNADNFEIEWNPIKIGILARKFNVDTDTFNRFIFAATMPEISLLCIEDGKIYSSGLRKRLSVLCEKRKNDSERIALLRKKNSTDTTNAVIEDKTDIVAATTTQSKVKESKVKESKVEIVSARPSEENFEMSIESNVQKEDLDGKKRFDTPEGLFEFAVSVFDSEPRQNGVIQTFAQNAIVYDSELFKTVLQKWSAWQIEHDNFNFSEKNVYASVLRWIGNEKRFLLQQQNKNGNPVQPKGLRPPPTEFVPFTSFT